MLKNLKQLEKIINYKFKDNKNLLKCLTHKSYDPLNNNEKIEFLGDRVLGLIISEKLLKLYPNYNEGKLDKKFASLVNRKKCLEISRTIKLDKFIITGNQAKKNTIEDKIASDTCEALVGAIYLDGGFVSAKKFINRFWGPYFDINEKNIQDFKTKLQELSQQKSKKLPEYKLLKKDGPSHSPIFTVSLKVLNLKKIKASGSSIREAEKNAAKTALILLNDK